MIEIPGHKSGPTFLVLHGYGADAQDLAPLSHAFTVPVGTHWLIPNGPLEIPLGPHYSGRAWAPINMAEWQMAIMQGRPRDLANEKPPEMVTSQKAVVDMLKSVGKSLEETVLVGFSQGAMLATQLAFTSPVKPKDLIILSGTLINQQEWLNQSQTMAGFKYFQCHGKFDEVLPLNGAQKLNDLLKQSGAEGEFFVFEGGHEIPPTAIQKAQEYILNLFPEEAFHEDHL